MRTNIDIGDSLMDEAQRATGLSTKKATVEAGLRTLARLKGQEEILNLAGKVKWQGDLAESRKAGTRGDRNRHHGLGGSSQR